MMRMSYKREKTEMKKTFFLAVLLLVCSLCFLIGCREAEPEKTPQDDGTEVKAVKLELSGMRTAFGYGEAFSSDGLTVTAAFSDGTKETVPESGYKVNAALYDAKTVGTYTVIVICSAHDLKTNYKVTVAHTAAWNEDGILKILTIGNSFSDDAMQYVYEIAQSVGIKVSLGNLFFGSCSVDRHADNLKYDREAYEYRVNTNGSWVTTPNFKMSDAIRSENWDFISVQPGSLNGTDTTSDGAYDRLGELTDGIRALATNASMQLCFNLFWSREAGSTEAAFLKAGQNTLEHYRALVRVTQETVMGKWGLGLVYPCGTAIQNARSSWLGQNGLTRDSNHLSYGLGRYIAGLTLLCTLAEVDPGTVRWAPADVTADLQSIAVESVENALARPFEVTQSRYTAK